jgi:hypothetical protein
MRTTLDIADDVLIAIKEIGRREHKSAGTVISELARRALTQGPPSAGRHVAEPRAFYGIKPLPVRGVVVTDEVINGLREDAGD